MSGAIPPLPHYTFMVWCSKHRATLPLPFTAKFLYYISVSVSVSIHYRYYIFSLFFGPQKFSEGRFSFTTGSVSEMFTVFYYQ
jgi:hypothetical protein